MGDQQASISDHNDEPQTSSTAIVALKNFAAGSAAGIACKTVEYPFDTVKVLLQTQKNKEYKGVVDCFRKVITRSGFFSLYKGLASPLVGSMAENAMLFVGYGVVGELFLREFGEGRYDFARIITAGAGAGVAAACVLTPVELIKCKLQIQNTPGQAVHYNGPIDCAVKTVKAEGLRGLFRGHVATIAREVPGNAAWFGVYETLCKAMTPEGKTKDDLAGWQTALAGGFSGMAYWSTFYPADTVKSRMQTDPDLIGQSFRRIFAHIYRTEGIRGLYKGWGITVSRAMPSNAALFMTYELVSRMLGTEKTSA